jgi:hypothetical protein
MMELITEWKNHCMRQSRSAHLLLLALLRFGLGGEVDVLFCLLLDELLVVAVGEVVLQAEEAADEGADGQPDADEEDLKGKIKGAWAGDCQQEGVGYFAGIVALEIGWEVFAAFPAGNECAFVFSRFAFIGSSI